MQEDFLWWRDGVIYQIYPRSFADSNADGFGDLNGITEKLDYIQSLGVDAVWLSPIYPTPDADFGYDVSDYTNIDPRFGTLADFDHLLTSAHQRGLRIVLDLVLNHTSDQHPWFLESRKDKTNPKRDWYLWRDPAPNGGPPNNWVSTFGGPGWELDKSTGQYYFHMFYKEQPDVNWRNPDLRQAMLNVFRFWLERGVDGFRLDVFNCYFKDAAFRSNPRKAGIRPFDRLVHVYDNDRPEMLPLLEEIRGILDEYPDRYAIGETFLATAKSAAIYSQPGRLHAAFNFDFLKFPWRPRFYLDGVQRWEQALHPDTWPTYVLNNHDVKRIATRIGKGEDDERLKVAAAFLLTQRGTPFLYYGEEIGMRDIPVRRRSEIKDPIGKRYWPIMVGRDGCRSPMQWDSTPQAGFTSGTPWLPVHQNAAQRNVTAQEADPNSLLHFYRQLLKLRRETPALRSGMTVMLTQDSHAILSYLRQTADQTVLVALNFRKRHLPLVLGAELRRAKWKVLLSSEGPREADIYDGLLPLAPNEVCILVRE
ncbi:MAG: alpha-amylase family glycosyl hydrolase [Anaerolineaceae bacterium]|jgi:alpha-glucosidase|nr:alpha-amylase family glycosyl hydrolase [Anaerolineaceae bacterium]